MSEWQPIETAPQDGTHVDLWGTTPLSNTYYSGAFRIAPGFPPIPFEGRRSSGERRTDIKWCTVHRCWRVAKDTHFVNALGDFTPTHWMPLPPPPTRQETI